MTTTGPAEEPGGVPVSEPPVGATSGAPAEFPPASPAGRGMFNNYAIVQGVDHVVPVDMYLPGCPPRPEMLIDAILKLHDKVLAEPLGDRRRKAIEARIQREGAPVVPAGAMPSSYRFDKDKRKQWELAAAQGREEQLRIENWMKARNGGVLPHTTVDWT